MMKSTIADGDHYFARPFRRALGESLRSFRMKKTVQ